MAHTAKDLESAIDKIAAAGLTEAEVEALAAVIADPDEVSGYGVPGSKGWIIIESLTPPTPRALTGEDIGILRGSKGYQSSGSAGGDSAQ